MGKYIHAPYTTEKCRANQRRVSGRQRSGELSWFVSAECSSDVFGVKSRLEDAARFDSVDLADEVFNHVFQLLLALDDGAHTAKPFGVFDFFKQDNGVGLCYVIDVEAFGGFGLDADVAGLYV